MLSEGLSFHLESIIISSQPLRSHDTHLRYFTIIIAHAHSNLNPYLLYTYNYGLGLLYLYPIPISYALLTVEPTGLSS